MFAELPTLLGRNFAVGYLLPSGILLAGALGILYAFDMHGQMAPLLLEPATLGFFVLVVYSIAILVLALNQEAIRLLEGYPWPNMIKQPFLNRQRSVFDKLQESIDNTDDAAELGKLQYRAAILFPDSRNYLLPTKFGNSIRAFEVYSRVVYGFESVGGWERLLAVIPKEYQEQIDNAKANMDLWVNLCFAGILLFLFYIACALSAWKLSYGLIPIGAIAVSWGCIRLAHIAAVSWGTMVRSGVDLYLPVLGQKLGLDIPQSPKARISFWNEVSRSMIHRQPMELPGVADMSCEGARDDGASSKRERDTVAKTGHPQTPDGH